MDGHDQFITRKQKPGSLHARSHDGISGSCSFTDAMVEFANGTLMVEIPVSTRAKFIGRSTRCHSHSAAFSSSSWAS
jgi:hypothetical protein